MFHPRLCAILVLAASAASAQSIHISGTIADSAGVPIEGADVRLERAGLSAVSGKDGAFSLGNVTVIRPPAALPVRALWRSGRISLELPARGRVSVTAYGLDGSVLARMEKELEAGSHGLNPPGNGNGVRFYVVGTGKASVVVRGFSLDGMPASPAMAPSRAAAKSAAGEMYDVITVTKSGYIKGYLSVAKAESAGVAIRLLKATGPRFSFFVTSMRGLNSLAKSDQGFGGDFRFGETGPGAGLRGADRICATLAERSMPGAYFKGWRAFLSVTSDAYGKQVNAIDRIGQGPWYDRLGRVFAPTLNDLKSARPQNGDPTIQNDFPNETGVLNHHPGPNGEEEDNHHMITGSNAAGALKGPGSTCKDWTTAVHSAANGKPASGLSFPRGSGAGASNSHWISAFDAPGCAAGIEIVTAGPPSPEASNGGWIGGGGGYGGFYCFALNP